MKVGRVSGILMIKVKPEDDKSEELLVEQITADEDVMNPKFQACGIDEIDYDDVVAGVNVSYTWGMLLVYEETKKTLRLMNVMLK